MHVIFPIAFEVPCACVNSLTQSPFTFFRKHCFHAKWFLQRILRHYRISNIFKQERNLWNIIMPLSHAQMDSDVLISSLIQLVSRVSQLSHKLKWSHTLQSAAVSVKSAFSLQLAVVNHHRWLGGVSHFPECAGRPFWCLTCLKSSTAWEWVAEMEAGLSTYELTIVLARMVIQSIIYRHS